MTLPTAPVANESGDLPAPAHPAATRRWLCWTLLIAVVLQWGIYHRAFSALPAVDVFPELCELHRGETEGPVKFFTWSWTNKAYRPLDSLLIWFFGRMNQAHPEWGIHFITLLFGSSIAAVGMLWARELRLSRVGAVAAVGVMCLHPILVMSMVSMAGVDSVGSTAMLWLGAYMIFKARSRWAAVAWGLLFFCVGSLLKEYTFALAPIAVLVALLLRAKRRPFWKDGSAWLDAGALMMAMIVALVGLLEVRKYAVPHSFAQGGLIYIALGLQQQINNVLIFSIGLLFFGNSPWAFFNVDNPWVLSFVGLSCMVTLAATIGGVTLRYQHRRREGAADDDGAEPVIGVGRWIAFLFLAIPAATWPAIIMFHVSEMYLPPLVVPFALLVGLAVDGFARGPVVGRVTASIVALGLTVMAVSAVSLKVDDMVASGQRADYQLKELLRIIPPDARDWSIAVLYDPKQIEGIREQRNYATIVAADEMVICEPDVLEWPRWQCGHIVQCFRADDPEYLPEKFCLTVLYDTVTHKMTVLRAVGPSAGLRSLIPRQGS